MGVRSRVMVVLAGAAAVGLLVPGVARATTAGTVSPSSIPFGTVLVNSTNSRSVTIQNTGDVDETISETTTGSSPFSSPQNCDGTTLTPGSTCQDQVDYDPATLGATSGTFSVVFTSTVDSSTAQVDVPLSGTAVWPPLRIQSTSLRPSYFYPLVRDGFRDWATYSFTLNEAASGTIRVFNHKGTLTKSWSFTNRTSFATAWGGRNRFGSKVKPGYYRFRVVAHTHGRTAVSALRRVQVKTGFRLVTTKGSKTKHGTDWSSRNWKAYQFGGNCNWGNFLGSLITTCLQAHATITYAFELPKGAKVTSFSHSVTPGITPCRHVNWTASHVGRIHRATFTHGSVNDFSQCNINSLRMTWKKTHKIRI
jgi:hypothetical protein